MGAQDNGYPTAWNVTYIHGSGHFLMTPSGSKLAKISPGKVHFWDKYRREDVVIDIDTLAQVLRTL